MLVRKKAVFIFSIVALGLTTLAILQVNTKVHLLLGWRVEKLEKDNNFLIQELQFATGLSQPKRVNEYTNIKLEQNCETIHIALVVVGSSTIRSVATLTKSILFYRHSTLHFHFVSDERGQYILLDLFATWKLPSVKTSFYSAAIAEELVTWIPNSHYSGVFGLMKLTLPSLLPKSLQKVIVIDTDLMLMSDISSLWNYFDVIFAQDKLIGLVENQSDWYLGNLWEGHKPWPALGRGFNTGVMLFNLKKMRDHNWNDLWSTVTAKTLLQYQLTALADQDIINTIIMEEQHLHYVLPCFWNAQLSEHSLNDYCYHSANKFKILHWNSPVKQAVKNKYSQYFEGVYEMFKNQDGYEYQKALLNCDEMSKEEENVTTPKLSDDPCIEFRKAREVTFRTHSFVIDYDYKPRRKDVTLVTQMSVDRLHMLAPLYANWNGPISLAVYATDSQINHLVDYILKTLIQISRRLSLHVMFKKGSLFYPVNHLRNFALQHVHTPYVFLSDIDFLPMDGSYEYLLEAIKILGKPKRLLVIPAFETHQYKSTYPQNKVELLKMLENETVSTFRYHEWTRGHAPTNYEHWKQTGKPYKIKWAADFEPYIVTQSNVSRYDERFLGFGWNKVSHIMKLNALGYEFVVLPAVFVIHMPHSPSSDIENFRKSKLYRDCVQVIKTEFQSELDKQYTQLLSRT